MAGSCNAASCSLVDVDIPKLSESPWPGDIFCTSMELGRQIAKELDLKLTLGMAERQNTESPPDEESCEESWGAGPAIQISVRPKVILTL